MKVLVLIIASDTLPVYAEHKMIWKSYMNSHPLIDSYFVQYADIESPTITDNTLWLPGQECFSGIMTKTIDGLRLLMKNHDYVVRTNLSSLWIFPNLIQRLEALPKERVYAGDILNAYGVTFVSGAGIIMSNDVAQLLVENRHITNVNIIDDVDIGAIMGQLNIPPIQNKRTDFNSLSTLEHNKSILDYAAYHFRIKHENDHYRYEEPYMMWEVIRLFALNSLN